MADNVGYNTGTAVSVGSDDIGGVQFQRVKVILGSDGTNLGDLDVTNQMPVSGTVTVAGSVSVSGTAIVSVVPGVSITIQQGASVSLPAVAGVVASSVPATSVALGMPVWIVGGQTATGVPVLVTIASQTTVVSGLVSVTGVSVGVVVSGAVSISAMPAISISVSAVLGTIITQLGTQVVSVVPGLSVTIQAGVSVSAVVSGTVSISGPLNTVVYTTTQATGVTGMLVYLAQSQTMNLTVTNTVTITGTDIARTQVMILVTSTLAAAGTTLLFTVYQGATQTVAGVGIWVVPAGKTFRVLSMAIGVAVSITTTPVYGRMAVIVSAATPTWTSAIGQVARIGTRCSFATAPSYVNIGGLSQDVAAGLTVAIAMSATTATTFLTEGLVMGYLYP